ncbi:MAG TPA: hypothetical protein VFB34_04655 [Chloroflexota bacterium]|nr:hypothetical protein [Chloroflexota bacterium]
MKRWLALPPAVSLTLLSFAVYMLTLPADLRNNADTVDRFFVTRSLLHGHLSIVCGQLKNADTRLAFGRHHCLYAVYAPGQSLLMAPLYVAGKIAALITQAPSAFAVAISVRSLDAVLAALCVAVFFFLCVEAGYSRRTAIILGLILAFASTLWPDQQSGQEHTQVTLALLVSGYAALKSVRLPRSRPSERDAPPSRWRTSEVWTYGSGAAAGFGLLTRYDFAVSAAIVFLFLAWASSRDSWRTTAETGVRFMVGMLPFLVADGLWNLVRFGSFFSTGRAPADQFGFPIWQGIANLLASPGKGIIWYVPLVWLLPLAAASFFRRSRPLFWLCAGLVASAVLFYANVIYWHGDPGWGPRYLFPVVPFVVLPLGELLERWKKYRGWLRGSIIAVVGLSLVLQLAAVSVDPWRFWYHLIHQRQSQGQVWVWSPTHYSYYWNLADAPELYQFVAAKDVLDIALGNKQAYIRPVAACFSGRNTGTLGGVSCRPLDTISPIWLNDRYQWVTPGPVALSLPERVIIVGVLLLIAGYGGLALGLYGPARTEASKLNRSSRVLQPGPPA